MATTAVLKREGLITGSTRFKLYQLTKGGTDASVDIVPGKGYTRCVGSEIGYTVSSGTFSLLQACATTGNLYDVLFLAT